MSCEFGTHQSLFFSTASPSSPYNTPFNTHILISTGALLQNGETRYAYCEGDENIEALLLEACSYSKLPICKVEAPQQ